MTNEDPRKQAIAFWGVYNRKPPAADLARIVGETFSNNSTSVKPSYHLENQKLIDKYLLKLKYLPGVKAVAVCNSHSLGTDNPQSDIDLFIVLNHRTFFTSRLLVTAYFQLIRKRRHGQKISNRFCLSFFISDKRLDLSQILLGTDYYFYYWFRTLQWYLIPDSSETWAQKLWQANQEWLTKFGCKSAQGLFPEVTWQQKTYKHTLTSFRFSVLEPFNRWWQIKRAKKKFQALSQPTGVIIEDGLLKFHVLDKRESINHKVTTRMKSSI